MDALANICRDLINKKEPFVLARIVDTHGSTPRKKGAWMILKEDGSRLGSIGGGILEAEVERLAQITFYTREAGTHHFKLSQEEQDGLDMRCGGNVSISLELIHEANSEEAAFTLEKPYKAYIFGAGHIGKALEPILRYVNFSTVVIDDRQEYANRRNFPEAEELVVVQSYEDAFKGMETDENSFIVIVTRGHKGDYDILKQALTRTTGYIGMIGSKRKVGEAFRMLQEEGFKFIDLERVHAPIGTDILAETPEEIAISITGEMIRVRANKGK